MLCNGAHDALQSTIAVAAGTDAAHVAVQSLHQHSAPVVDTDAQKLLAESGAAAGIHITPNVFQDILQRLAAAVKESLGRFEPFDQIGTGQAKVDRVASSRRARDQAGKICIRFSVCKDAAVRALPEGRIDPCVKTITLSRGGKPLVRLHYYATHPQTKYGDGRASSDMVGDARQALERKEGVFQIYFTGCGGDITVGKYNDGTKKCRVELGQRLLAGMEAAVAATKLVPVGPIRWRTYSLLLPPRSDPGYSVADCLAQMKDPKALPVTRLCSGALRVAFYRRSERPIQLSSMEIGNLCIVHLPGEPMVNFQLFAQGLRPGALVAVAGYGDGGPSYICTKEAAGEGGYEPTDSNLKPEAEAPLKKAIATLLGVD